MTIWSPSSNTTLLTRISPPYPSFLHSAILHPGMFVIISPIQLLLLSQSSHAPTPQQRRNMCDVWCREMTEWYKLLLCKSVGLDSCCLLWVSISIYWRGQVWRVTGESNCLESLSCVGPSGWWHNLIMLSPSQLVSLATLWHLALATDQSIVTPLLPSWYILFSNIIIRSNVSGLLPTRHCYPWLPLVTPG